MNGCRRNRGERGLSLLEVAVALLLSASALALFFSARGQTSRDVDQKNIAEWISVYASALQAYAEDHADEIVERGNDDVREVGQELLDGNYLASPWRDQNAHQRKMLALIRAACVDDRCTLKQPVGLVALTGADFPDAVAQSIAAKVNSGGGVVSANGAMSGIGESWKSDIATWGNKPSTNQPVALVAALPKRLDEDKLAVIENFHYLPHSAALPGKQDGGLWEPLYKSDYLELSWQQKNATRVRLEVVNAAQTDDTFFREILENVSGYALEPSPAMVGKRLLVRLLPLSETGSPGIPAAAELNARTYPHPAVTSADLEYKIWTSNTRHYTEGTDEGCLNDLDPSHDSTNMYFGVQNIAFESPNAQFLDGSERYLDAPTLLFRFDVTPVGHTTGNPHSGAITVKVDKVNQVWLHRDMVAANDAKHIWDVAGNCRFTDKFAVGLSASVQGQGKTYERSIRDGYIWDEKDGFIGFKHRTGTDLGKASAVVF